MARSPIRGIVQGTRLYDIDTGADLARVSPAPRVIDHEDHSDSRPATAVSFIVAVDDAPVRFRRADEATRDVACRLHCARWIDDCTGPPRSGSRVDCDSRHCRGSWCRRRAQHVVRRRHRRRDDAHRQAANPARQDVAHGSAFVRACPCRRRGRRSWLSRSMSRRPRCSPSRSSSTSSCTRCG